MTPAAIEAEAKTIHVVSVCVTGEEGMRGCQEISVVPTESQLKRRRIRSGLGIKSETRCHQTHQHRHPLHVDASPETRTISSATTAPSFNRIRRRARSMT